MRLFNDKARAAFKLTVTAMAMAGMLSSIVVTFLLWPKPAGGYQQSTATHAWPAAPQPGICLPITITEVHDGDTLTAEIKIKVSCRLLDCWAPEVTGTEKPKGIIARDKLREIAHGKRGVLLVPTTENFGTSITFGRVLGHVWLTGDPKSLSQRMVEAGMATREKQ